MVDAEGSSGNAARCFAACVLAAGKGTRMGGQTAKVLRRISDGRGGSKTMLDCVLETARKTGCGTIVVIVGFDKDAVIESLPEGVEWVYQAEQLGTGHAVSCARERLADYDGDIMVLSGDVPLIRAETLRALHEHHVSTGASCTLLYAEVEPPNSYGKVVRTPDGTVLKIVEAKDASEEEKLIREVNAGTYCFKPEDLFAALPQLERNNVQSEYYLTDVVALLAEEGKKVEAVGVDDPAETMGVDSDEALARASELAGMAGKV